MNAMQTILEALRDELGVKPNERGPAVTAAEAGRHWAAILSRRCGLSSVPGEPPPARLVASLIGQPALEVAGWVLGSESSRACLGMAAINSLIEVDESRCIEKNARELLIEKAAGRQAVVVGHFPFLEELRAAAGQLWVLELSPRPGDLPASHSEEIIPQADVVGITGMTLVNQTFDHLVALCRPEAYVVLLGGSVPLTPHLFQWHIDALAGTIVDQPLPLMQDITSDATFRQLRGKRHVLMLKSPSG